MVNISDKPAGDSRNIYSPSELNREARLHLEAGFPVLWVSGEISNLARPASGHMYFSLKDAQAQIRCALFRQKARLIQADMRNGQQVLVRGKISLYEPRGDYQLIADFVETAGEGLLRQQFEALKKQLAAEGLFADSRKQTLPAMPHTIGVITSPSGAAIKDFMQVLQRRWPLAEVIIYPSSVQGEKAPAELLQALQQAQKDDRADVLVLTRGGGSLEDLWAFNDEQLARQIADCPIPVVSAVGHEIDFSISDFAADVRAPTPSAAAELVSPDQAGIKRQINHQLQRLQQLFLWRLQQAQQQTDHWLARLNRLHPARQLQQQREQLQQLEKRLQHNHPAQQLAGNAEQLKTLEQRLQLATNTRLQTARQQLNSLQRALQAVGPQAVLSRGYALVTAGTPDSLRPDVLTRPEQLPADQPVTLQFADFKVAAVTTAEPVITEPSEHDKNSD